MSRFLLLATATCVATFLSTADAVQVPPRLEQCLPIPTPQHEIQQRTSVGEPQFPSHIQVEELTFNGQPGLPPEEIEKITDSLTQPTYQDNPDWVEELHDRISDAWQHRGYFRVRVENGRPVERAGTEREKRFAVSFVVDAGRLYYLQAIDFRNNTVFTSTDLRTMFPINDGELFDTHQLQQGVENLRRAYGAKGYINFSLVPSFELNGALIKTKIELDEGKPYRVGQIKILGLAPDVAQSLLQESGLEHGKVFNPLLLENFFERNSSLLPPEFNPVEDVQRSSLDEQQATVDITMDFRRCPRVAQH